MSRSTPTDPSSSSVPPGSESGTAAGLAGTGGGGTSQQQRRLDALDPSSVGIEERGVEEFLVFARNLAGEITFHDHRITEDGSLFPTGDWRPFFEESPTAVLAEIATTDPVARKQAVSNALSGPPTVESLRLVLDGLHEIARSIDVWWRGTDRRSGFRSFLGRRIAADGKGALRRLAGYDRAAFERFDAGEDGAWDPAPFAGFSAAWSLGDAAEVIADESIFQDAADPEDAVRVARPRLEELLGDLFGILDDAVRAAPRFFEKQLGRADHEPHLALLVAFLELYGRVREEGNRLTGRHLDFFYRKVLGIAPRPAEPDHIHLLIEHAPKVFAGRDIESYALEAGTPVDAGGDASGTARIYRLDEELVLNRAAVAELRSIYVVRDGEGRTIDLRAAPVANSADGRGGSFAEGSSPSWPAVGDPEIPPARQGLVIGSPELALAEGPRMAALRILATGWPASWTEDPPDFGTLLRVRCTTAEGWFEPADPTFVLEDLGSGEGGTGADGGAVEGSGEAAARALRVEFALTSSDPAIAPADREALGEDIGTDLPAVRIDVREEAGFPAAEEIPARSALWGLTVTDIELSSRSDRVRNLLVANDQGPLDPGSAFSPFGARPAVGARWWILSPEAASKQLSAAALHLGWEEVPADFVDYYAAYDEKANLPGADEFTAKVRVRRPDREASEVASVSRPLFSDSGLEAPVGNGGSGGGTGEADESGAPVVLRVGADEIDLRPPLDGDPLTGFRAGDRTGFIELELEQGFLHDRYAPVLTRQTMAAARMPTKIDGAYYRTIGDGDEVVRKTPHTTVEGEPVIPNEPFAPVLAEVFLSYESIRTWSEAPDAFDLVHLHPFEGTYEVLDPGSGGASATNVAGGAEGSAGSDTPDGAAGDGGWTLVPVFEPEGTLLIGLTGAEPLQSVSILFQAAEGTADPELSSADLQWSYLVGNEWRPFEEHQIAADTTGDLVASGILELTLPSELGDGGGADTTVLPADRTWIRALAPERSEAVSELVGVHAGAVRVTFEDRGNDPSHLEEPLPAGSVKGLLTPQAAIAAVRQPYSSFGGRTAEGGLDYYTRVSEHLRHKGRAITRFDYERIVLEAFPEVYKVKCVNHTDAAHRTAPGRVMVAVIPDYKRLEAADRRRPRLPLERLEAIETHLHGRNAAHVAPHHAVEHPVRGQLEVVNPVYESVRVSFLVKFRPDVTALQHEVRQLQAAIVRHLSPWAFEEGGPIRFGGRVYRSAILDFVENRPKVDYVAEFRMMHGDSDRDLGVIEPETPRSILVPAYEKNHTVTPIEGEYATMAHAVHYRGIGSMTLGEDFRILPSQSDS